MSVYKETSPASAQRQVPLSNFQKVILRVAKLEDRGIIASVSAWPSRRRLSRMSSPTDLREKSRCGLFAMGVRNAFRGLSVWLSGRVHRYLENYPCLAKGPEDIVRQVCGLSLAGCMAGEGRRPRLLSGQYGHLATLTSSVFGGPRAQVVHDAVGYLCSEQYLECRSCPNRAWRVVKASGMRLAHSLDRCRIWHSTHVG